MGPEKSKSLITSRQLSDTGTRGKGETVDDDKASLVKPAVLPFAMQRKVVASSEDNEKEKEKLAMKQKASQMQRLSNALFNESEKKK